MQTYCQKRSDRYHVALSWSWSAQVEVSIDILYGHGTRKDDDTHAESLMILWFSLFQQSGDPFAPHCICPSYSPAGSAFLQCTSSVCEPCKIQGRKVSRGQWLFCLSLALLSLPPKKFLLFFSKSFLWLSCCLRTCLVALCYFKIESFTGTDQHLCTFPFPSVKYERSLVVTVYSITYYL